MPVAFVFLLCLMAAVLGVVLLALLPLALALSIFSLGTLVCVFWIWMLVDAIRNEELGEGEKIGWVLAIVFLHFIGGALYFFLGRSRRTVAHVT